MTYKVRRRLVIYFPAATTAPVVEQVFMVLGGGCERFATRSEYSTRTRGCRCLVDVKEEEN
jgi:hypothetical protein